MKPLELGGLIAANEKDMDAEPFALLLPNTRFHTRQFDRTFKGEAETEKAPVAQFCCPFGILTRIRTFQTPCLTKKVSPWAQNVPLI